MNGTYFRQYHADVITDNIAVIFSRLFEDEKDIMSDDPRPSWVAQDKFDLHIKEFNTIYAVEKKVIDDVEYDISRKKVIEGRELTFHGDKNFANNMWKLAKRYDDFDTLVKAARVLLV